MEHNHLYCTSLSPVVFIELISASNLYCTGASWTLPSACPSARPVTHTYWTLTPLQGLPHVQMASFTAPIDPTLPSKYPAGEGPTREAIPQRSFISSAGLQDSEASYFMGLIFTAASVLHIHTYLFGVYRPTIYLHIKLFYTWQFINNFTIKLMFSQD